MIGVTCGSMLTSALYDKWLLQSAQMECGGVLYEMERGRVLYEIYDYKPQIAFTGSFSYELVYPVRPTSGKLRTHRVC